MARRYKHRWVLYEGGPFNGAREVLEPSQGFGPRWVYSEGSTPDMRIPHLYDLTDERRRGGFHESAALVAVFVRSLPEEPEPAGVVAGYEMAKSYERLRPPRDVMP